ncbi:MULTISPECIES: carboxynorspermidine decarboxylase [Thalassospira]|mgnify:FL=1|jgi:carboxynorspermidine decarboxylase|uniref:Carboxynorspermidine/carboxyspermidine decarboxylase n=1 Tax=Thalassospira povalilytica TaxID=732237 RepID=A0ABX4R6R2_9PROT|nr:MULTISPECIES: carboxynorspermidine decarboxylase [Thalassospira]MEE3045651.1 carboxynorspermidine decarboxylase [Pseudomonadota bacterium]RCK25950.1 carboxynorspermidine decarboxylase [Thalassospira profundimaris]KZB69980.1 carboxynorspermidine decarboxylase [Thalassospira sp. MCCC 1A02491]MBO6771637.1 carboxynorspermidine decarboxylase [Thalassospira sp.]PKR49155.1 carboxynorspermidine decarboxylase [Thalassospira povalilytica]|tara:strand:- start:751 stop:1848 length:1098 start_codon:yes stop_codon:yes gene_type:complete
MPATPYYLIDKSKLLRNMEKIAYVREHSGAKALLALKCFATWSVFDFMSDYMDGTTSSSLHEVKLGRQKFGKETHAYSVAYSDSEIAEVIENADKIIFNSISQLTRFSAQASGIVRGLRLNPQVSTSSFDLADPARPFSRLGEWDVTKVEAVMDQISGFMIHNNCENADFDLFDRMLGNIEEKFGSLLSRVEWVSLGGGIHFTGDDYPLDKFCARLKAFSEKFGVQVYLEPGEASITKSTTLEVTVLDTLFNGKNLAIVDSSIEAHMLDLLIYRESAKVLPNKGDHHYMICGKSCLAGDVFGEFDFENEIKVGDRISIQDAAGYTMVKKNWFNGVGMPSIVIRELDGTERVIREFTFDDYVSSLS